MAEFTVSKGPRGLFYVKDGDQTVSKGYMTEQDAADAIAAGTFSSDAAAVEEPAPVEPPTPVAPPEPTLLATAPADPVMKAVQSLENEVSDIDAQIEALRKKREDAQAERDKIVTENAIGENEPFHMQLARLFAAQDAERGKQHEAVQNARAALGLSAGGGASPLDVARMTASNVKPPVIPPALKRQS